ncbi:18576_t:CDS:2 [Dentiscutata erythropus]|uniref:18576_t:CDS:1 n=1 Tax=Dentiscutata erythropus TaxID=1348616 RepID=A0A9N9AIJ0_9GLOM|nr:18576_t:CDS:2 [Dentiscutata erythropus]
MFLKKAKNFVLTVEAEDNQRSAEIESNNAINILNQHYQDKSEAKNENVLDEEYNVTYDIINEYSNDDKNQKCEINRKGYNKPDNVIAEMDNKNEVGDIKVEGNW